MKLSNRMEAVAAMVSPTQTLADIGTDHGYVPVALVERGVVQRAIAADVRPGPLSRAQCTIAQAELGGRISTRLSDGLGAFEPDEADAIVIAGMGGALIIRILQEGRNVARRAGQLILQPQSEIAEVRKFLLQEGYTISDEEMLCEDGKFYTVIQSCYADGVEVPSQEETGIANQSKTAAYQTELKTQRMKETEKMDSGLDKMMQQQCRKSYSEVEYAYGRILLQKSHPVLKQYLEKEKRQLEQILEGIPQAGASPQALQRREEILHRLELNHLATAGQ